MRVVFALALAVTMGIASAGEDPVVFKPASEVRSAFAKGRPLLETSAYKVHASRRESPGRAEVHVTDTDIIYVLDGQATFVTGGTVIDGETVEPNEIRGSSIRGGSNRHLAKGDFAVVPSGVPHWFQQVDGPLLYYVVKVPAPAGGTR